MVFSDVASEADRFGGSHESSNALSNVRLEVRPGEVQFETKMDNKVPNGNKKNMKVQFRL